LRIFVVIPLIFCHVRNLLIPPPSLKFPQNEHTLRRQ
jgi:hypothetical protein